MKRTTCSIFAFAIAALVQTASAVTHYVDLNSANATPPFNDWSTAATNIQDAIDVAVDGDLVLVTNGIYATGGRVVYGSLTNRVAATKAVTVQSVNGPSMTIIQGNQDPTGTNGSIAVRCVYLTNNATLVGFTLTNGSTLGLGNTNYDLSGGGLWCESTSAVASNCVIVANKARWLGAGTFAGMIWNCFIINNTNYSGTSGPGGAVAFGVLIDTTVSSNKNVIPGGFPGTFAGAVSCVLSNCFVSENFDVGAQGCTLYNCLVTGNRLGISGGTAYNCVVSNNIRSSSYGDGGGAYLATLNNCIICDNLATNGGGAFGCTLNFCIVSNNIATRYGGGLYSNASNFPLGQSNTLCDNFAGVSGGGYYLAGNSAITNWNCINNSARGDGGGFYSTFGIQITHCTFASNSAAGNGGGIFAASTVTCSNCTFVGNIAGVNGGGTYNVLLKSCLVEGNNAQSGGGAYNGRTANNSLFIDNVASVNGGGAYNVSLIGCLLSGNWAITNGGAACNSSLSSCIVTNNWALNGGGAYNSPLTQCILAGNSASNGGGAYGSTITECLLTGNSANYGGGTYAATVMNCTVSGNSATNAGGGVFLSDVIPNSIIYYNSAPTNANYYTGSASFFYCCTTPLPLHGSSNMTNSPAFIDLAGGNFRLQTNSPCINAGVNPSGLSFDLDGRQRVVGGVSDIGAYEFQGPGIGEFTAWLQQYGLPTNGSGDFKDPDSDGLNNWQEWIAGTIPTDSSSVLKMFSPSNNASGLNVSWQSVSGKNYFLERATDLGAPPAFSALQSNIVGQASTTVYMDTTATNGGPYFYRVGVQ